MDQVAEWRKWTATWAVVVLVMSVGCFFVKGNALPLYQAQSQDLPVLGLLSMSVLVTLFWAPAWRLPAKLPAWWILLTLGLGMAALLAWGAYAVFGNYALSRDEHMVVFDMAVYAKGRLATPLAPFWRPYAGALVPDFLDNDRMPIGLVSGYLPVNALLRLGLSKLADPVWLNPLLALAGGAAFLDIARRTFGPQDRAVWVVLLVYTLSAQMLVNAMTPFSVTGHMALNLIWLAAFLRGGKVCNAVAIVTGFLAVGLHQLVFHPVFVAPFLLWRLREGQWRIVLLYAGAYAAIILWWAYYPILAAAQAASVPGSPAFGEGQHANFITDRVMPLLFHRTPGTTGLMVLNLLRFFAWQNFAMLPLFVAAVSVAIRQRGLPGALLLGIVTWLALLTFIMPYQGLGWGYRYLSPYLGSFALLAGFGYRRLEKHIGARADGLVLLLSGVTLVAAIPALLMTTHRFAEPYLVLERLIARQSTPFVVIDTAVSNPPDESWALHPLDQVRNLPDLSNRPVRLSGNRLNAKLMAGLCGRGQVTVITRRDMHRVGFELNVPERSPWFEGLVRKVEQKAPGCLRSAEFGATQGS
jgi:hypothetical protein